MKRVGGAGLYSGAVLAMVTAVIKLARSLGFRVVAEHVEDMSALDAARRIELGDSGDNGGVQPAGEQHAKRAVGDRAALHRIAQQSLGASIADVEHFPFAALQSPDPFGQPVALVGQPALAVGVRGVQREGAVIGLGRRHPAARPRSGNRRKPAHRRSRSTGGR